MLLHGFQTGSESERIDGTLTPDRPPPPSRQLRRARVHDGRPRRDGLLPQFGFVAALLVLVVAFGAFPTTVRPLSIEVVPSAQRFTLPGLAAAIPPPEPVREASQPFSLTRPSAHEGEQTVGALANSSSRGLALEPEFDRPPESASRELGGSERVPLYFEYEVQPGDTVSGVAARFGVSAHSISWNNLDVRDLHVLTPGQRLQVPATDGILHPVRVNETVTQIAAMYEADWRDIVEFAGNGLSRDPNNLAAGSLILVPGGSMLATGIAPERPSAPVDTAWVWPLQGRLTSLFESSHPLGIDIAAPLGSPLLAARDGVVAFAGGDSCCSYGLHVIIDHGDGYETVYAHLDSFAVAAGTVVSAGDVVGYNGLTGLTTGPHIHFELRRNGVYQDPLSYLP